MLSTKGGVDATAGFAGRNSIAGLVPCYNEEAMIGKVVADFQSALPEAAVSVYDNNSTGRTVAAAIRAGAVVRREQHRD